TALEIIMVSSSSTFNFRHNQNAKYQTDNTTISDCTKPNEPAFKISEKITLVPSNTKPILTSNSALRESLNHWGSLNRLPTKSPMSKLKITASKPKSFKKEFPANSNAPMVSANTIGKLSKFGFTGFPVI